ncbi:beta-N-acetylhexosaminidase, partial [Streptomyces californicus]
MTPENPLVAGAVDPAALGLVPAPRSLAAAAAGPYPLGYTTPLTAGPGTQGVARWLRATLGPATGLPFPEGDGTGT